MRWDENEVSSIREHLKKKLREIFHSESEELDFGIHRVMNYKRKEIDSFINHGLMTEIRELAHHLDDGQNVEELERFVYNHLLTFLSRYYQGGDFISQRRYGKKEKHVIPYNGEEVFFYWTSKNQYYIKTTEFFWKYSFRVQQGIVNFRLVAAEEEKGNVKAPEKRFFILHQNTHEIDEDQRKLTIYFEYRTLTKDERKRLGQQKVQEKINEETFQVLKNSLSKIKWAKKLFERVDDGKSLLERHLFKYTKRNSEDYFIHKDLREFLVRELDHYITVDFLGFDDFWTVENEVHLDELRTKVQAAGIFRKIAMQIIEVLSQIENFQKKLWEKKKLVLTTHYLITLDRIENLAGREFLEQILSEILENEEQVKEWEELLGLEVKNVEDLMQHHSGNQKVWKSLALDTRYFDEEFKWNLLTALSKNNDLDALLDGILVKSENWQALNLLSNKYQGRVQTIYIDPPYNSPSSEILYKNDYKHSSWLTLMENRLEMAKRFLREDGVLIVAIDEHEQERLGMLLDELFHGWERTLITVMHNPRGQQGKNFSTCHEHAYFIYPDNRKEYIRPIEREKEIIEELRDHGGNSLRSNARTCFYPIIVKDGRVIGVGDIPPESYHPRARNIMRDDGSMEIWPLDNNGIERKWTHSHSSISRIMNDLLVRKKPDGTWDVYRIKTTKKPRTVWIGKRYDASVHGSQLLTKMGFKGLFTFPKSLYTVLDSLRITTDESSIILDFFAGSGTTAHATMLLNKQDGGKRKFFLVEMADYFDTVIIPRIKKLAYSFKWKDGRPLDDDGIGIFVKYHSLEQYEDTLENVEFETVSEELYRLPDYFIKYMLEWETKNSKIFLDLDEMKNPFNYSLKVIEQNRQKLVIVDLIETFNYLLGLDVKAHEFLRDGDRKYVFVYGTRHGKKLLIVWRNVEDLDLENDKKVIEARIKSYNPDEVYVNGDALLEDFLLIEPEFKELTFKSVE